MNPKLKTTYFTRERWPQEWIDVAKNITQDEYERSYANVDITMRRQDSVSDADDTSDAAGTKVCC